MNTWTQALKRSRNRLELCLGRAIRVAVLGIGQELRGDDAAGLLVAELLQGQTADGILVIPAGSSPENFTGVLRRFAPDLVLLVDAAQMEACPGEIRWLDLSEMDGISATTHTFPLSMLAGYLTAELGCAVALIGIQPQQNEIDCQLSSSVCSAVEQIAVELMNLS